MANKMKSLGKMVKNACQTASASFIMILILSSSISRIMPCMVPQNHFPKLTMPEILHRAEVVVWGKNTLHFQPNPNLPVDNSRFQVYCVYKDGGSPVAHNITIYDVSPINSCKGESLNAGKEYLISLRRRTQDPGIYEIHHLEVNPIQRVSIQNPSIKSLVDASTVCGLENPHPPTFKKVAGFGPASSLDVMVHHTDSRKCPRSSQPKDQCLRFPKDGIPGNIRHGTTPSSGNNAVTTVTKNFVTTEKNDVKYAQSPVKDGKNAAPRRTDDGRLFFLLIFAISSLFL